MTHQEFAEKYLTPEVMQELNERSQPYENYFVRSHNKKTALRALYTETDLLYNDIDEDIRRQVKCKKGCAHCCHIRAVCTPIEAEVAVDYAKDNGIEIDVERLKKQQDLNIEEYMFSLHKRCVFLQPDNTCGIYPVRPFACRTYFVVNEPEFCDTDKYPGGEQAVVNNLVMTYPVIAVMAQQESLDSFPKQLLKAVNEKGK